MDHSIPRFSLLVLKYRLTASPSAFNCSPFFSNLLGHLLSHDLWFQSFSYSSPPPHQEERFVRKHTLFLTQLWPPSSFFSHFQRAVPHPPPLLPTPFFLGFSLSSHPTGQFRYLFFFSSSELRGFFSRPAVVPFFSLLFSPIPSPFKNVPTSPARPS